jgi:hypothetical protein
MRFQAKILQRFQSYEIPVIKLKKAVSKEAVCHVFEKVKLVASFSTPSNFSQQRTPLKTSAFATIGTAASFAGSWAPSRQWPQRCVTRCAKH